VDGAGRVWEEGNSERRGPPWESGMGPKKLYPALSGAQRQGTAARGRVGTDRPVPLAVK